MKKLICYSGLLAAAAVMLSGCGNAIPEMDEEQRSMVINYAADVIQRYDSNHPAKLQTMVLKEMDKEVEEAPILEQSESVAESEEESSSSDMKEQETEIIDNTMPVEVTLDEFLQKEAFSFSYVGYETDDSYPQSGEEAFFAMNATTGTKLLVLKFTAQNLTQSEQMLDMLQSGVRFKVQVNGETKNALTTMLLNDFANCQETVEAGGIHELVVVCEIPTEQAGDITSLALVLRNADGSATISLY